MVFAIWLFKLTSWRQFENSRNIYFFLLMVIKILPFGLVSQNQFEIKETFNISFCLWCHLDLYQGANLKIKETFNISFCLW
jgi:hypothetical protein